MDHIQKICYKITETKRYKLGVKKMSSNHKGLNLTKQEKTFENEQKKESN